MIWVKQEAQAISQLKKPDARTSGLQGLLKYSQESCAFSLLASMDLGTAPTCLSTT